MKTMTRIRKTMLILLTVMTMMFAAAGPAQAASARGNQKIYKTYASFLAKKGYLGKIDRMAENMVSFQVAYINGDSVPDLVVFYYSGARGYRNALIYTYKKGKVVLQAEASGDVSGYYKKKNFMVSSSRYNSYGEMTTSYFTPAKKYQSKSGDLYKTSRYRKGTVYQKQAGRRTQKISSSNFNRLLKRKTGKTRYTAFKPLRNTAANRKSVLGF